jgi:rhodanese-related sulfurtransferase
MNSIAPNSSSVTLPDPADTFDISVADTRDLLASALKPILIDCREEDEHAYCRIAGAVLLPLAAINSRIAGLLGSKETPAIIYCHHGMRSMRAVTYLRDHGFSHVFSMRGGIDAWSSEIDPSVPVY